MVIEFQAYKFSGNAIQCANNVKLTREVYLNDDSNDKSRKIQEMQTTKFVYPVLKQGILCFKTFIARTFALLFKKNE